MHYDQEWVCSGPTRAPRGTTDAGGGSRMNRLATGISAPGAGSAPAASRRSPLPRPRSDDKSRRAPTSELRCLGRGATPVTSRKVARETPPPQACPPDRTRDQVSVSSRAPFERTSARQTSTDLAIDSDTPRAQRRPHAAPSAIQPSHASSPPPLLPVEPTLATAAHHPASLRPPSRTR